MTTSRDVAEWLKSHDDLLILTHLHPDGDALGSSLALCLMLESLGRRAAVCCQDGCPGYLGVLPALDRLYLPESLPFEPKALTCVDLSVADRLGRAAFLLDRGLPLCCVDHHEQPTLSAEVSLVEPQAAASGELIDKIRREMDAPLTRDMALCLYVAISTDTGNFAFSCTTPDALRTVADCVETGIDIDAMNYELFRKRTRARTKLLGRAIEGMIFPCAGKIALMTLRGDDFAACGAAMADTEGAVNFGVNVEGVLAAILAVQQGGQVKFSLRSRGAVNVAALLRPLGGGGHERAAGLTLEGDFDACVERVLTAVQAAVEALG